MRQQSARSVWSAAVDRRFDRGIACRDANESSGSPAVPFRDQERFMESFLYLSDLLTAPEPDNEYGKFTTKINVVHGKGGRRTGEWNSRARNGSTL